MSATVCHYVCPSICLPVCLGEYLKLCPKMLLCFFKYHRLIETNYLSVSEPRQLITSYLFWFSSSGGLLPLSPPCFNSCNFNALLPQLRLFRNYKDVRSCRGFYGTPSVDVQFIHTLVVFSALLDLHHFA